MRDRGVLLVMKDAVLKQRMLTELVLRRPAAQGTAAPGHYQVSIAGTLEEALLRCHDRSVTSPAVIVLDQSALSTTEGRHAEWPRLRELAEVAPVVFLLDPGQLQGMNGLAGSLRSGRLEMVLKHPHGSIEPPGFLSLALALVERHAAAKPGTPASGEARLGAWQNFGEILRHELNNPLTGILGNAELLLARRDRLPPADVERLQTIADMAVRLRETVRRLGNAWEDCSVASGEVEVES